jgi:hypothetical protein
LDLRESMGKGRGKWEVGSGNDETSTSSHFPLPASLYSILSSTIAGFGCTGGAPVSSSGYPRTATTIR